MRVVGAADSPNGTGSPCSPASRAVSEDPSSAETWRCGLWTVEPNLLGNTAVFISIIIWVVVAVVYAGDDDGDDADDVQLPV